MKRILIILTAVFILAACEEYQPLPEPELPVVDITFTTATYYPASESRGASIQLVYTVPVDFTTVFQYYNKNGNFNMAPYLKNKSFAIESTMLHSDLKMIEIFFSDGVQIPETLTFNPKEPMYFGSSKYTVWGTTIVVAKGFIETDSLPVNNRP